MLHGLYIVLSFEYMLITVSKERCQNVRITNCFLEVAFEGQEDGNCRIRTVCEETLMSDIRYLASRLVLLIAELDIDCGGSWASSAICEDTSRATTIAAKPILRLVNLIAL
jgi:hypothetical protein